jgi:hypothetical protein
MKKYILIFIIPFYLISCSKVVKNHTDPDDQELIKYFINDQKKKLPVFINEKMNWIDVYSENEKIIYVYKINMLNLDDRVINQFKKTNYSPSKINEICNTMLNTFYSDIELEYKYINVNNRYLFDLNFKKSDCR